MRRTGRPTNLYLNPRLKSWAVEAARERDLFRNGDTRTLARIEQADAELIVGRENADRLGHAGEPGHQPRLAFFPVGCAVGDRLGQKRTGAAAPLNGRDKILHAFLEKKAPCADCRSQSSGSRG